MRVRSRLERIERTRGQGGVSPLNRDTTHEDWLDFFTYCAELEFMDYEKDSRRALAEYRLAIEDASRCDDPPFFPPNNYEPKMPRRSRL